MIDTEKLKMTTLIENSTASSVIQAEWGLSIFIEVDGSVYLFDTGTSGMVVSNADALNIDLSGIDRIVLSHGHYDHTGGLLSVLKRSCRKGVHVTAHPNVFDRKYSNKDTEQ